MAATGWPLKPLHVAKAATEWGHPILYLPGSEYETQQLLMHYELHILLPSSPRDITLKKNTPPIPDFARNTKAHYNDEGSWAIPCSPSPTKEYATLGNDIAAVQPPKVGRMHCFILNSMGNVVALLLARGFKRKIHWVL